MDDTRSTQDLPQRCLDMSKPCPTITAPLSLDQLDAMAGRLVPITDRA